MHILQKWEKLQTLIARDKEVCDAYIEAQAKACDAVRNLPRDARRVQAFLDALEEAIDNSEVLREALKK